VYKVFKKKDLSPYFGSGLLLLRLNVKARLVCRAFVFYLYFYCSERRALKFHFWQVYFICADV